MTSTTTPVPEPTGSGAGVVVSGNEFTEFDARRLNRVRRYFAAHPRASDVLVCALMVVEIAVNGAMDGSGMPVLRLVAVIVLGLIAVAALWFRRRSPVLVLGALALLAAVNVGVSGRLGSFALAIGFGVYTVAASRTARMTWWIVGGSLLLAGLTLVASAATVTGGPNSGSMTFGVGVQPDVASELSNLIFTSLIALVIGTSVSSRRAHVNGILARHQELLAASEQQASLAAATEQTRIAREMHDVVAHGLTVMVALSDGARTAMRRSPDDADRALELLSETGRTALTDMRRMLGVLRGNDVPLEPQPQDLDELVQSFRVAGMTVHLTTSGPPLPEDPTLALTVYRVVQESLTNALRHAGPHTRAEVIVARTSEEVLIEVTDSGSGGAPAESLMAPRGERLRARLSGDDAPSLPTPPRPGRGLVGMRERAAVYGGSVSAGPHQSGWRVQVLLQIDPEEDR
jgi:signal transduction histidine kinase